MEPPNFSISNWVPFDSHQNPQSQPQNHHHHDTAGKSPTNHPGKQLSDEHQEVEFNFNAAGFNSPENKMCTADEVFFRGQILPFRHSVSLPSGFMTRTRNSSFSRSEPVSRSSSTRSQNSGTSGSTNSPSGSELTGHKPVIRTRNRNQFHSYPSPTPQIRTGNYRRPYPKPQKLSFFQLGVLKPREIGLSDLKNRSRRSHGSVMMKDENEKKTTTNHLLLFGGCKCSAIEVENGVSWRIPMVKDKVKPTVLKEESNVGKRKHAVASYRTSEWLKQFVFF
ncbi:hypothetical protein L6452_44300 [Arctium lappa]|uniref:Uncharacterized protein n=1 Tax=Arctium lappa TaxID=4217 RepID=A0ACB8XGI5_ARCLA|nr:hypothetical protein L6452_44300 [Arctium lappa]